MADRVAKSGVISSDSTDAFEVPVNNNGELFNVTVKLSEAFVGGRLYLQVKSPRNDIWESVYTGDGRVRHIDFIRPRSVLLNLRSVNAFRFIPQDLDTGKSYEVFIENMTN